MKPVDDDTKYWLEPPPAPSPQLLKWQAKIAAGWRPNRRVKGMGYEETMAFYGVYRWEYLNVLWPLLYGPRRPIVYSPREASPEQWQGQPSD